LGAPQHRLLRRGENTWQRKAGKQNKTSETNFPRNLALNHAGRAAVAGASPFGTATGANPFQSKVRSEQHSEAELFAGFDDNDLTSLACLIRDIHPIISSSPPFRVTWRQLLRITSVTDEQTNTIKTKGTNYENESHRNKIQVCARVSSQVNQHGSMFGSGHSDLLQCFGGEPVCDGVHQHT